MRILVHDDSGHPFQAELSRELSRRGHDVTHSYCAAHVSGRGRLSGRPGDSTTYAWIGDRVTIHKTQDVRRLVEELRLGGQLARQAIRLRPDVALVSNVPIPALVVFALAVRVRGVAWVLWQQDARAVAVRSFAGARLSRVFRGAAWVMEVLERWCVRRAAHVVVIAESFLEVHRRWGTEDKVTVIPNWAPLQEIVPTPRDNAWAAEHGLVGRHTLLYAGTLGLKHDPALLVALTAELRRRGCDFRLVVVNEGPAEEVLLSEAARVGIVLTLLPLQPYERLSEVLGSGDALVVLLDAEAGAFSVPSKALSYLCAGRPVLGFMPAENSAARLVSAAGGTVVTPSTAGVSDAAAWVQRLLADPVGRQGLGVAAGQLAELEFSLRTCADRFEGLLTDARSSARRRRGPVVA